MLVHHRCGTTSAKSVVESVFGSLLAQSGARVDLAEERCHPLLVDQFTLVGFGFDVDDDGGPVVPALESDGLGASDQMVARVDRTVEQEVLLTVNELHQQFDNPGRSEEHTSELQSLMRSSYAVFCLKK